MLYKTHMVGGFCFGVVASGFVDDPIIKGVIISTSVFGSLLPDIDKSNTRISNKMPILHSFFAFTKHRGFTHSVFFQGIVSMLIYFLITLLKYTSMNNISMYYGFPISIGLFIGMFSHDFYDLLTVSGLKLFYPLSHKTYHLGNLNGKRDGWWVSLLSLGILFLFVAIRYNIISYYF